MPLEIHEPGKQDAYKALLRGRPDDIEYDLANGDIFEQAHARLQNAGFHTMQLRDVIIHGGIVDEQDAPNLKSDQPQFSILNNRLRNNWVASINNIHLNSDEKSPYYISLHYRSLQGAVKFICKTYEEWKKEKP